MCYFCDRPTLNQQDQSKLNHYHGFLADNKGIAGLRQVSLRNIHSLCCKTRYTCCKMHVWECTTHGVQITMLGLIAFIDKMAYIVALF